MMIGGAIRKTLTVVISLAVLAVILFWMSGGFARKIEPHKVGVKQRKAAGATTDTVHAVVETEMTDVVGTLRAERRMAISATIMATIADITVGAGAKVKKGQVLVRLDDRDLKARLAQAKKAAEATEASAKQAAADLKRYEELIKQKVVSKQEYEQQRARNDIAQAELERARQAVVEAEVAVSYAVIEAPSDGVVVDKAADKGDTAAPGQPILTLYDPSALRLEAEVRETLATQIRVGDRLKTRVDALELDLEGLVDEIVPQAAAASRTVLVKVAVPRKEKMVEGMFGRLFIPTGQRRRYCVALSAVREVGQLRFVDVVTTGGVIERRSIQMGEHSEFGHIEVLSGLQEGEQVVLYGPPPPPFPKGHPLSQEGAAR